MPPHAWLLGPRGAGRTEPAPCVQQVQLPLGVKCGPSHPLGGHADAMLCSGECLSMPLSMAAWPSSLTCRSTHDWPRGRQGLSAMEGMKCQPFVTRMLGTGQPAVDSPGWEEAVGTGAERTNGQLPLYGPLSGRVAEWGIRLLGGVLVNLTSSRTLPSSHSDSGSGGTLPPAPTVTLAVGGPFPSSHSDSGGGGTLP